MVVAGLVAVLGPPAAAVAGSTPRPTPHQGRTEWERAIAKLPVPGAGCFTASYPHVEWRSSRCVAAPRLPYSPAHGPSHAIVRNNADDVGDGVDYSAAVSGLLSSATGSFDAISPGTTETGLKDGGGPEVPNTFSLQLNTKPFTSPACTSSPDPACKGWEQFLYSTTSNTVFIQYWLIGYSTTCPAGWMTFGADCFENSSATTVAGGPLTVASLSSAKLTGSATSGGSDTVELTTSSGSTAVSASDTVLGLAGAWTEAEFAVVGDCCGTKALFSSGTTLQVRTTVHSGTTVAPTCVLEGFTGETNNLNLAATPAIGTSASPAIVSQQTSSPGMASCASANSWGDTHLTTFHNLLYDFQASGDFELATGPKFVVQTRQVSGAPSWPNAALNHAVATRLGHSRVALCLPSDGSSTARLVVGTKTEDLASGGLIKLSGGGYVSRTGSTYLIRGATGDSVSAQVYSGRPSWMRVTVGVGHWPEPVHGLLADTGSYPPAVESSTGTVLPAPFNMAQFYGPGGYADSWRVPPGKSLLGVCGGKVSSGVPTEPLYARDLGPKVAAAAQKVCFDAGIQVTALLDACTVDVAVLHRAAAALFYRDVPADFFWGEILSQQPQPCQSGPPSCPIAPHFSIVGVGSDTTGSLFDQLSVLYDQKHPNPPCVRCLLSWGATNPRTGAIGDPIMTKLVCPPIPRPDGSSSGIIALTMGFTTGEVPCVDFARSSRGRSPTDPPYGPGGISFITLAGNAVTYATQPGGAAPRSLTRAQLAAVFTCKVTNWDQIGGKDAPIDAQLPRSGSDTRTLFLTALGGRVPISPGKCVDAAKGEGQNNLPAENQGVSTYLQGPDVIYPYSVGQYLAESYHSAKCLNTSCTPVKGVVCTPRKGQNLFGCDTHGTMMLNSINGTAPTTPFPLPAQCGFKCPVINPGFTHLFTGSLYTVVPYVGPSGIPPYLLPIFGPAGFICTNPAAKVTMADYGFRVYPPGTPTGHSPALCGETS
jgi:ABC-type phosphate transport system substrate-binding protein